MKRNAPEQAIQRQGGDYLTRIVLPPPIGPAWTSRNPVAFKSAIVAKISKSLGMKAGWPDIDMVWKGRYIGIELKAARGKQSPHQRDVQTEIVTSGGVYVVVKSLDEFIAQLDILQIPTRAVRKAA